MKDPIAISKELNEMAAGALLAKAVQIAKDGGNVARLAIKQLVDSFIELCAESDLEQSPETYGPSKVQALLKILHRVYRACETYRPEELDEEVDVLEPLGLLEGDCETGAASIWCRK